MSLELTQKQRDGVARIRGTVMAKVRVEVATMAEMMVSKPNREVLGETEFVLRDRGHRLAVDVLDAARQDEPRLREDPADRPCLQPIRRQWPLVGVLLETPRRWIATDV